jgi:hypothetical protein
MNRIEEIEKHVEEIILFDCEGGKVTKSYDDYTRNRQLILEVLEEDIPYLINRIKEIEKN